MRFRLLPRLPPALRAPGFSGRRAAKVRGPRTSSDSQTHPTPRFPSPAGPRTPNAGTTAGPKVAIGPAGGLLRALMVGPARACRALRRSPLFEAAPNRLRAGPGSGARQNEERDRRGRRPEAWIGLQPSDLGLSLAQALRARPCPPSLTSRTNQFRRRSTSICRLFLGRPQSRPESQIGADSITKMGSRPSNKKGSAGQAGRGRSPQGPWRRGRARPRDPRRTGRFGEWIEGLDWLEN